MNIPDILQTNRVILAHFDSYSAALLFTRWGKCLLAPEALPEGATPMSAPAQIGAEHDGVAVMQAAVARYGLNAAELVRMNDFDAWFATEGTPLRVHVLRFTGFEAPAELLESQGASFKPISELRGSAMSELMLLREVFNILVGGAQRATT